MRENYFKNKYMKYVETIKFYTMLVALDNLIQYFIFTFILV